MPKFKRMGRQEPQEPQEPQSAAEVTKVTTESGGQPEAPRIDAQDRSVAIRKMAVLIGTAVQEQQKHGLTPAEVTADIRKPTVALEALEEYAAFVLQVRDGLRRRVHGEETEAHDAD